jgi:hypothetical protein
MEPEKGFSFRLDAPIDMRLDPRVGQSAADFLESASYESLSSCSSGVWGGKKMEASGRCDYKSTEELANCCPEQ